MSDPSVRAHVLVSGHVQGVGFRYSCRSEVRDVAGWVRNLPDGRVEAVFEGSRKAVDRAIEWCRQGPPSARVSSVDVAWEDPRGERGFRVTH
jgi:acylphosphatase